MGASNGPGRVPVVAVRAASEDDGEALREIERRAGERFREVGLAAVADDEPPARATLATYAAAGRSWVATDGAGAPIGYVIVDVVDGCAHVEQISVLPDRQGGGVGRALLDRVEAWAAGAGLPALTLTTFADVPWNRPLYEHLGYRVLADAEIGPELRAVVAAEAAHGLDPATRVCMRRDLPAGAGPDAGAATDEPYRATAQVYDLIYEAEGKDYGAEAEDLHRLVQERSPGARTLLDVACGTGAHLARLRSWYEVAGVDASAAMVERARQRLRHVPVSRADMRTLDLGRRFDAVVCLFSSVGYMGSTGELDAAIAAMASHLSPGGVLVVDGWVRPEAWRAHPVPHAVSARDGDLAAARVVLPRRHGRRTQLEIHHLVGAPDGVEHHVEIHELTLFTDAEYRAAFARAGLTVEAAPSPMTDRDRYVGLRERT